MEDNIYKVYLFYSDSENPYSESEEYLTLDGAREFISKIANNIKDNIFENVDGNKYESGVKYFIKNRSLNLWVSDEFNSFIFYNNTECENESVMLGFIKNTETNGVLDTNSRDIENLFVKLLNNYLFNNLKLEGESET